MRFSLHGSMLHYYKLIFYTERLDLWKGSVYAVSASNLSFLFFFRKRIIRFSASRSGEIEKLMRYIFFFFFNWNYIILLMRVKLEKEKSNWSTSHFVNLLI